MARHAARALFQKRALHQRSAARVLLKRSFSRQRSVRYGAGRKRAYYACLVVVGWCGNGMFQCVRVLLSARERRQYLPAATNATVITLNAALEAPPVREGAGDR